MAKYTDEQIKQALNSCFMSGFEKCGNCPLKEHLDGMFSCLRLKQKLTIDLINRQEAEIERLRASVDESFKNWLILDKRTKQRYAELYEEAKEVVRAESIKEFAERLKEKMFCQDFLLCEPCDMADIIDNLVKEMVGESDA